MLRHRRKKERDTAGPLPISGLFDRIRARLRPPQAVVVDTFRQIIEVELGIKLAKGAVRYNPHSRTIVVSASGAARSEIALQRTALLARLRGELGVNHAPQYIV